jgi:hypothetical protein
LADEKSADGCPPPATPSIRYSPLDSFVFGTVKVNSAVPELLERALPSVLTIVLLIVAHSNAIDVPAGR